MHDTATYDVIVKVGRGTITFLRGATLDRAMLEVKAQLKSRGTMYVVNQMNGSAQVFTRDGD